jgi:hypothetical protein
MRGRLAGGRGVLGGPNIGRDGEGSREGFGGASIVIRVASVQQQSLKTG